MDYKVDVPVGTSGHWEISRFSIGKTEAIFSSIREPSRSVSPGLYTKLTCDGFIIMSDTPAEVRDHLHFIYSARELGGRVLINGLGLGLCVDAILRSENGARSTVQHVTVIEKSPDVIALCASHYLDRYPDRLDVIEEDAFTWKAPAGSSWTCVWHDIWSYMSEDNLTEMATLHRRYGRRCLWQGSWGKEYILMRRAKAKRHRW